VTNQIEANKSSKSNLLWIGIVVAVVILAAAVIGVNSFVSPASSPAGDTAVAVNGLEPAPIAGRPAPDFTLKTLGGQKVSLSDFAGRPVIINFWATWCGPCRIEMPHLQSAFVNNQADGVVVLGVNLTQRDSVGEIPAFLEEFGLTFPIVLDEKGEVANTYKVFGQPASIFVGKDGTIQQVFYGPVNEEFINDRIEELLAS